MRPQVDIRQYLGVVLHAGWLILLAAMISAAWGYRISSKQPRIYRTSTTISVQEPPGTDTGSQLAAIQLSQQRIQTYAQLLTASPLLNTVGQQLGYPNGVPSSISVAPVRDTELIHVSVLDTDPRRAAQVANTLVTVFGQQRRALEVARYALSKQSLQQQLTTLQKEIDQTDASLAAIGEGNSASATTTANGQADRLQTSLTQYRQSYSDVLASYEQVRLAEAQSTSNIIQEEPAAVPTSSIAPQVRRDTGLYAMMGLVLAGAWVFLSQRFNDKVSDPGVLAAALDLPLLGLISRGRDAEKGGPIAAAAPRSSVAEAYRGLRTNIEFTSVDRPLRTLLVTSPTTSDGKSTVCINLASVLGQGGREVAIIDTDLRRPTIHRRLMMSNTSGLSELFVQPDIQLDGVLRPTVVDHVAAITSGPIPPNPADLLGSHKMGQILEAVQERADIVLLDSPPVTAVTDAAVLAARMDGVLLVVRAGRTRLRACELALEQLRHVGANVIGVVVNDIPLGLTGYGYASLGYYDYLPNPEQYESGRIPGVELPRWLRRKSKRAQPVREQS